MLEKAEVAFAALETYAKAGRYQRSVQLWQKFFKLHDFADATVARCRFYTQPYSLAQL